MVASVQFLSRRRVAAGPSRKWLASQALCCGWVSVNMFPWGHDMSGIA